MSIPPDVPPAAVAHADEERHASWPELFFDLVVVAGVGELAHVLTGELTLPALGLYAVLFLSFWLTWTTFMLYGNIAAGTTAVPRLLVGMFGLGVMAASVPDVAHNVLDGHGRGDAALTGYVLAYVLTRWFGSQSWRRGEVLLDFPVAQHLAGTVPWLLSLRVHGPDRAWWWAAGVVLDLVLMLAMSGPELLQRSQRRIEAQERERRRRPATGRPGDDGPVVLQGLSVDREHLSERLGLFVLIVLGESVVQVVQAASAAPRDRGLLRTGLACFLLLAALFLLCVVQGYAGLPHLRPGTFSPRGELALHSVVTGTVATIAVALSAAVEAGDEPLPAAQRWLLCAAVAAWFTLGLTAYWTVNGWRPGVLAGWAVAGVVVPLLLGALGGRLSATGLVGYMALTTVAHVWVDRWAVRRAAPQPA